jgi:eukaryotic-like serine/threonine-protein kinase
MALSAGDKLGPYEILSPLGAGGMGEVYKARDTRLDRLVAIKVLPEHIAKRVDSCVRFEREAQAVASLNHPHICVLHDIGNQNGTSYMVMELLEGETLATRIAKGPIPLQEALTLATQIADALDRAHRAGVTHRDVKPGNIMLTRDGVKVLDFGLAKSKVNPAPMEETLTAALTTEGTVLGTPQYMAPEQFEGREADVRSDVWAFGAVLYEMVTGQKAFQGKSYSSLVGAILSADPAPMPAKPVTPAWLERLVRRCLAKDPEDRYQSMRDVVLDLKSAAPESVARRKATRWPWVVAAAATLLFLGVTVIYFRQTPQEQPVLMMSINPPDKAVFNESAISPNGKLLAFTATSEGKRQLWIRPLHAFAAQPLAGTDQAEYPFWSPDNRWIGFFAQGRLKKIDAAGGPAQTLCEVANGRGATWNADGVILYADLFAGLFRVSAQGGAPARLTATDRAKGEIWHRWPWFLPDGRRYLYLINATNEQTTGIYLGMLDSRERTRLVGDPWSPGYAEGPAGESYLLFVRAGTLMAQRFAVTKGALSGEALPIAENVGFEGLRGRASFSVSGNGMLVYDSGTGREAQLAWMGRKGEQLERVGEPVGGPFRLDLSPDEKQIALTVSGVPNYADVWVRDLERGIATRFTAHPGVDLYPVWSPNGDRIVFGNDREGVYDLYIKGTGGAGQEELLLKSGNHKFASDWTASGGLIYTETDPKTKSDLWVLQVEGERKPVAFLRTEFDERHGVFGPDAKWIAYSSDESGRHEIYIQPHPPTMAKRRVSREGGHFPRWRRDGKELYWLEDDGTLVAAEVSLGSMLRSGIPKPLFETGITGISERYAVSHDGERFLVPMPMEPTQSRPATVVWNWLAGAKR